MNSGSALRDFLNPFLHGKQKDLPLLSKSKSGDVHILHRRKSDIGCFVSNLFIVAKASLRRLAIHRRVNCVITCTTIEYQSQIEKSKLVQSITTRVQEIIRRFEMFFRLRENSLLVAVQEGLIAAFGLVSLCPCTIPPLRGCCPSCHLVCELGIDKRQSLENSSTIPYHSGHDSLTTVLQLPNHSLSQTEIVRLGKSRG